MTNKLTNVLEIIFNEKIKFKNNFKYLNILFKFKYKQNDEFRKK